jgi:pimeloyl-ACP methyl ester carboxylesterase
MTAAGLSAPAASAAPAPACHEYQVPVSLVPGLPATYHISGDLCLPAGQTPDTVQVLIPGASYNRTYWEFPMSRYSYVDAMTASGHAVFAMDRLDTGDSSRVLPALLTVEADAATLHQVVGALRAGNVGGTRFDKVVSVGHSLGSIIAIDGAALYHDVDGVILTGFTNYVNAEFVTNTALGRVVVPTQTVRGTSPYIQNRPLGDLTTPPGGRELNFYAPGTFDPAVLAADEATKDVITVSELASFPIPQTGVESDLITAPVFLANGQFDFPFLCGLQHCANSAMLKDVEAIRFAAAPSLDTFVLPNAGHDINLALDAPQFFAAAGSWMDGHFGG